ncbi:MAG: DUF1996 domain-containing protein [Caldilineaceae bacterium]|nr:DUF1996 domain-containing protein [Caldilineaceae bacterium]
MMAAILLALSNATSKAAPVTLQLPPIGEFVAFCEFHHRLMDDPIVFPGQPGASHSHEFMGNMSTDAHSTIESLQNGSTTCDPITDRSSYWVPTLFDAADQPVAIEQATFYYLVNVDDPSAVQSYPLGLKIIAGNAKATQPAEAAHIKWSCLGAPDSSTGEIVTCPTESQLELLINFPDCWNGHDLDSADHKSQMAYSAAGVCPATHPVVVPALQFKLRYATNGTAGMRLASGPGYTAHGDFFNAWDSAALINRLQCLHKLEKCGAAGYPQEIELTQKLFLPTISR